LDDKSKKPKVDSKEESDSKKKKKKGLAKLNPF
jgi:outer membrane protein assembly factor BamD